MDTVEGRLRQLAGEPGHEILVDVGTSTVTGVRAPGAAELARSLPYVGHPVLQTVVLDARDTAALGSDFSRAGIADLPPAVADETFVDPLGVEWLWAEGAPAPLNHPLEDADYLAVARHPRPVLPKLVQPPPEPGHGLVVADAPTSGIVETCFSLRNGWQFMLDITDNWRVANALLDWCLDMVATTYEHMLRALPREPDVVLYGDDYGYQGGMFLSDDDFRTFVRPRLRTLFSRIRRMTSAAICFHCCGAVRPILGDLADLGVEMLNLQYDAKEMQLSNVRAALPSQMILHGYTDLRALGEALRSRDRKSVALLTDELVRSAPCVAAPVDSLADESELMTVAHAAAFVRALSDDDVNRLRRQGPIRDVLERAMEAATDTRCEQLSGHTPDLLPIPTSTSATR